MYAKSFMALDGNGRLTGAITAQTAPYDRYSCHLCASALQYHPEYDTERPWFEHHAAKLSENGRQHCPYVKPGVRETRHIRQLQSYVPEARPRFSTQTGTVTAAAVITTVSATASPAGRASTVMCVLIPTG